MFLKQCSIQRSTAKYIWEKKKQINYKFIPTTLFRGRPIIYIYIYMTLLYVQIGGSSAHYTR